MRVMAIDYGDARTGIAVSDASATLAGDAWALHEKSQEAVARAVASEAVARGVGTIVVGYPRNMDGTAGPRAEKSERLAGLLRSELGGTGPATAGRGGTGPDPAGCGGLGPNPAGRDIEIKLWDERLTTMSAHRILSGAGRNGKKRKERVDAVAASLILEGYLNSL